MKDDERMYVGVRHLYFGTVEQSIRFFWMMMMWQWQAVVFAGNRRSRERRTKSRKSVIPHCFATDIM